MVRSPRDSETPSRESWPWDELELMLEHAFWRPRAHPRPAWRPAVDVIEEEDSFTILVELPGVDPDAVKVTVKGHMLTIRGDRPRAHLPVPCRCVILERLHGPFERQVLLPAAADSTRMQAEFKDGVLLIHIVKSGNP